MEPRTVNRITDEELERILYGSACANQQIPRLKALCEEKSRRLAGPEGVGQGHHCPQK